MTWRRTLAALGGATALAGCYEVYSNGPVISNARRLTESTIAPGIYCPVSVDDAETVLSQIELGDCLTVGFEAGELVVASRTDAGEDEETVAFQLAALGRGLTLLQGYNPEGARYVSYVAKPSEDGVAILVEPRLTAPVAARAAALGLAVDALDHDLEANPPEITILAGAPDVSFELIDYAVGETLDAAAADAEALADFVEGAIVYVRVDAAPEQTAPDPAVVAGRAGRLRELVRVTVTAG